MTSRSAALPLSKIQDARSALAHKLRPSPVFELDQRASSGAPILLKAESLQPTGSFKIRGASYRIGRLNPAERSRGVIAYSTGNHAQAVARAASEAGVNATIVMSPDVADLKRTATERWGAQIVLADPSSEARRQLAEKLARDRQLVLIPPYDDLDVMAGQGTIGLELLEQLGEAGPACVFVPVGGGGLLAGVAAAIKQSDPSIKVVGVEPELEKDACESFHSGLLHSLLGPSVSIADAIKVQSLGVLTFPLIRAYVDEMITVSERAIASACLEAAEGAHLLVEPAGAVALAAAKGANGGGNGTKPIVAILTGGNVTLDCLMQLRDLASSPVETP